VPEVFLISKEGEVDIDFTDIVNSVELSQKVSKAGKPYFMVIVTLVGGYKYQYLCTRGEENAVRLLMEQQKGK